MTEVTTPRHDRSTSRGLAGFSPEAIFVISGIATNAGTVLAKSIMDDARPATIAWIRVMFGTVVLLTLSWRHWSPWSTRHGVPTARRWTKAELRATAMFGCSIALMNLFFYLGISRVDVGKGTTIEFIGPIAVAASRTRTTRNAIALGLAVVGVSLLSSFELSDNALGVVFILMASGMWAAYILLGSQVARQDRGLAGLGVGLIAGTLLITPIGAINSGEVFSNPELLGTCCLIGLLTTVIGMGLDQHILRRIQPGRFALLVALIPVIATVLAYIVLDERPSTLDVVGIALVIAGVITQQREAAPALLDEPPQ